MTAASASGTVTFSLSGCGSLSTSARYWLFENNSASTVYVGLASSGTTSYWFGGAYGSLTAGSSTTASLTSGADYSNIGITLAAAATMVPRRRGMVQ